MGEYDIAVIGAGHAGCEAALAAARLGSRTIMFSINLEAIAMMPCNPAIGGTGKGHLVREIDALGGEMGINIDKAFIQELEQIMEGRQSYRWEKGSRRLPLVEGVESAWIAVAVPILSEGDVMGCVLFMTADEETAFGEVELKLAATVAKFLGKQME